MANYTNQEIINAFRNNNSKVIDDLYIMHLPMIKKLASAYSINIEIEDIMGDAMIEIVYIIDKYSDFKFTNSFESLLYKICKNNLIDAYRKEKRHLEFINSTDIDSKIIDDINFEIFHKESKKYSLFLKHFVNINEKCQELITMYLDKIPIKDIALKLGISEKYVRKRKFECKKILIQNITNDPEYQNLKL